MLVQAKNKANNSITVVPEEYLKFNDNLEPVSNSKTKSKGKTEKTEDN